MSFLRLCIGVFVLGVSVSSYASDITMRGFASFVAGQTLSSGETLYDYENDPNFRNDSLAAIQFGAQLDEGLSATVQMVARGASDYDVEVEWAYLTYEFNDSVRLNVGRMVTPFYRYSDYIDVGYAYSWVDMPKTVYGIDASGLDGFSLLINSSFGSWDSVVQFIYGSIDGNYKADGQAGLSWSMNRDWLTLRLTYFETKFTLDIPFFIALSQQVQTEGDAVNVDTSLLEDHIVTEQDDAIFGGLAVGIDYNDWLMEFEYIHYETGNTLFAPMDGSYLMLGKRFGKLTPSITFAYESGEVKSSVLDLIPAEIAGVNLAQFGGASISQLLFGVVEESKVENDLIIAGLRYDFHNAAAIKTEYLRQKDMNDDVVDIIRVGLDLVF